jgi:hypothetical protein
MTNELDFLKHSLDVLIIGDAEMISEHAKTVQARITRLTNEIEHKAILENYQSKIDSRIENLFKTK